MTINLDKLAADFSCKILESKDNSKSSEYYEKLETMSTKVLSILQEQGIYACILYLLAKSKKKEEKDKEESLIAKKIAINLLNMLNSDELKMAECSLEEKNLDKKFIEEEKEKILKHIREKIIIDIRKIFMIRSIYEKTLIYVRYGAKALS